MYEIVFGTKWIIGVVLVVVSYIFYWYRRPDYFPPGPKGFPFLGYFPMMGKCPQEVAAKLSKTYGPILSVRFGSSDVVFLNDYESVKQVSMKLCIKIFDCLLILYSLSQGCHKQIT